MDINSVKYHITTTWPSYEEAEKATNFEIAEFLSKIFRDGVLAEISRTMNLKEYPNCGSIGHIVLIAICSAIDSISAYNSGGGGVGTRYTGFITKYFPSNYIGKEDILYKSFRCDSVHGWNLHRSVISGIPNDPCHLNIIEGMPYISLYDLFNDLSKALDNYLDQLKNDDNLKINFIRRYKEIKK